MNDIIMCRGEKCPIKDDCYRFTAEVVWRQDFFGSIPYDFEADDCEHFWDNRPLEEEIRPLAYKIWLKAGCPKGHDLEHWVQAEAELARRAGRRVI